MAPPKVIHELVEPEVKHLMTIPSFAEFLSRPGTVVTPTVSAASGDWYRLPGHHSSLFRRTFRTKDTIVAWAAVYTDPSELPPAPATVPGNLPLLKCSLLVDLGNGLNGWPGVAHGSVSMGLMDEAMAALMMLNESLQTGFLPSNPPGRWDPERPVSEGLGEGTTSSAAEGQQQQSQKPLDLRRLSNITADIQIKYLRRVPTPGPVIVNAWLTRIQTTKRMPRIHAAANICDEHGTELVRAESAWATVPRPEGLEMREVKLKL